jgi:hypothetical protein
VSGIPSIEEQQELQKEEAERVRTRVEQLGKYHYAIDKGTLKTPIP